MSEPTPPLSQPTPELPEPFGSTPRAPKGSSGCAKPALLGCAVLLVLFGVASIVFLVKAKDLLAWTFRQMESSIVAQLPEDVTSEERARLERAFDAAARKAVSGEVEPLALQQLQGELMRLSGRIEGLTREDVMSLIDELESFAEIEPQPPPEEEAPEAVDPELTSV